MGLDAGSPDSIPTVRWRDRAELTAWPGWEAGRLPPCSLSRLLVGVRAGLEFNENLKVGLMIVFQCREAGVG